MSNLKTWLLVIAVGLVAYVAGAKAGRAGARALLDLGFDGTGVLAGRGTSYDLARRDPQRYLAALQHNSARAQLLNAPLGDFTWAITEIPPRSARTEGHALESAEDKERGVAAGADAYIVKGGFDQGALIEVIRRLLADE